VNKRKERLSKNKHGIEHRDNDDEEYLLATGEKCSDREATNGNAVEKEPRVQTVRVDVRPEKDENVH
jgi:hypothetical protein